MGLDMYLNKKLYVRPKSIYLTDMDLETKVLANGVEYSKFNPKNVTYVMEEVADWRKFNALHFWFVKNVQQGNDDCEEYEVTLAHFKKLQECLDLIVETSVNCLRNKITISERDEICRKEFPPTEGFFFGSTAIDEYYFEDVVSTKRIIGGIIDEIEQSIIDGDSVLIDYFYQSSW